MQRLLWTSHHHFGIKCCGQIKLGELLGPNHKRYASRKKNLLPSVKFGKGSVMLRGCVASTGTGKLVKVEGRMESTQYQQILGNNVQDSVRKLKLRRDWIGFSRTTTQSIVQNLPRNALK